MWHTHVEVADDIGSLCRKATLQVKADRGVVIAFSFLDFSGLCLLVGLKKPLEVVLLELSDVRVILLLGNLDTLIPSVKLLIHGHGLLDLVVLNEDCLGLVELLVEDCELSLNSEVIDAFLSHELVDLPEVVGL